MKSVKNCPCCGSSSLTKIFSVMARPTDNPVWRLVLDTVRGGAEIEQKILFCRACGCLSRNPAWDERELAMLYSPELWANLPSEPLPAEAIENNKVRRESIRQLLSKFGAASSADRPAILDIGGQNGFYVHPFVDAGWQVYVSDLNDAPLLDERMEKLSKPLESFENADRFHAIVASHVLEHVGDLSGFIATVRQALVPGGVVYVEVPFDLPRLVIRHDLSDPGHLYYFSTKTLAYSFARHDFNIRYCHRHLTTYNHGPAETVVLVAEKPVQQVEKPVPKPGWMHVAMELVGSKLSKPKLESSRMPRKLN